MIFSGGSDGAMHALKIATGEPVWNWLVSQRGLNTAALVVGNDVIVTHSEENIGTSEMGMLAAVPARQKGTLTDKDARWIVRGVQAGYASPVSDGERLYIVDNGGVLFAFDAEDGRARLGAEPRHDSEVVAGAGRRQAVRRHREREVLHPPAARGRRRDPRRGLAAAVEQKPRGDRRVAGRRARPRLPRVDGRALRDRTEEARRPARPAQSGHRAAKPAAAPLPAASAAALLVTPTELILKPGESIALDGAGVRRERASPREARAAGDLDAREPEGHDRERHVHGRSRGRQRRPAS